MGNATVIINLAGGVLAKYMGSSFGPLSTNGTPLPNSGPGVSPIISPYLQQILGLVPLLPCGYQDCRDTQSESCILMPVFGVPGVTTSTYQNDFNGFVVNNNIGTVQFIIERETNGWFAPVGPLSWNTVANIIDNTYGAYNPKVFTSNGSSYSQFIVNWGSVLGAFGPGIYRISVNVCTTTAKQAFVIVPFGINSLGGGAVTISGTLQIGKYLINFTVTGTEAQQLAYMAALINGSGFPFVASVVGLQLCITGTTGALANGTKVYVTLNQSPPQLLGTMAAGAAGTVTCVCYGQSIPFLLRAWNCDQAHGTTKFECWNTDGTMGDEENDGSLFDICGITIYDSIRVKGFFGNKSFEYDEETYQWGINNTVPFGTTTAARDKATKLYKWFSNYLPMWAHNTIATYYMMANTKSVSDYNHNNSDYNLIQRQVVKKSGYKPEYLDEKTFDAGLRYHNRTSKVEMEMAVGIQSIIKSISCQ